MRIANFRTRSDRDWTSIKEFREFDREEREKQRLTEDREQYQEYVRAVNADQQRVPPRLRIEPQDFNTWRGFADNAQTDPVLRGQIATNRALLSRVNEAEAQSDEEEREAILAGKPDKMWELPESAKGLRMSVKQANKFIETESQRFVDETGPEYYACKENYERIVGYLMAQEPDVRVPNADCFRFAFNRLRALNLLIDRPTPTPEAQPAPAEPQEPNEAPSDLVDGWDIETGEPRKYTQSEIWKMSSSDVKKAFRMWSGHDGDRRPKFTRSRYQ